MSKTDWLPTYYYGHERSARKNRNQTPLSGLVQVNTETDMRCTTEIIHREKFEIANYRATRHGQ